MQQRRRAAKRLALFNTLLGIRRSRDGDFLLGLVLATIAGAANAGGFFALGQYTSHMTGYVSTLADNIAVLNGKVILVSLCAIAAFILGSATSTGMIHWAKLRRQRQKFALPMALQGCLLFGFSWAGYLTSTAGLTFALAVLCFAMGMQNATITKISDARIRTTHVTGLVTDIGIELGRASFGMLSPQTGVSADRGKLKTLLGLVLAFLVGGVIGAVGYNNVGFFFSMPLALVLLGLSVPLLVRHRRDAH
ncbi:DUF1275 domain-containing protein [Pseudorhodobacter turbinis]|uniref:DUF1275 domain-containing protein n=1 Tax=Pseudorhodobacter turbinis TaxID=2500533 RepID=A0A4P8EHF7_9RHOB|nr:YoaK family protein [Pseudorhodobacter turbinis]QCO56202.1 DUF1275 domain-containing protein [Pseudorhodobacter turbinis]